MNNNPIITLKDIDMSRSGKTVLSDVNLTVDRGDFIAVTGPNGGGKTTLLRIILKLLEPTRGSVEYFNAEGRSTDTLSIGYLPQKNMIDSRFPITVSEVVGLGLPKDCRLDKEARLDRIGEMVELVGLESHSNASIGALSGGQLQRTLLARAIISKPELLVLDEPLSYVDRHFEQRIYSIIKSLAADTTIILVSHDMTTIATMANRHVIVDHRLEYCHSAQHFLHYSCCDEH